MVAFSMHISNHIRKGIPVYAAIDNNDGAQEILTGKDTNYDTKMTLFLPICKDLFWNLFENVIRLSFFNVFEMCVKKTLSSITIFRFCGLSSAYNLFTETLLMFELKSAEVWWLRITFSLFSLFGVIYWFSDLVLRRFHSR